MNMADCPIFAPAAPKMPADRLGLRGTVKREYDQSSAERMTRNVDGEFNRLTTYYGCATVTFASLADAASIAYNIPVHGPLFGTHYAVRVFVNVDLDGLSMSGYVSADDRVTVVFQNDTGGAVQPAASFEVCVIVERYPVGQNSLIGSDVSGTVTGGTAGGDTVITPPIALGSLVLTGYQPTLTVGTGNIDIRTTGLGSLTITGYAPSLSQTNHISASPSTGNLILTGYAPAVNQNYGDAVFFNGGTNIKRSSAITGTSSTTSKFTISFWYRIADLSTEPVFFHIHGPVYSYLNVQLYASYSNKFRIDGSDTPFLNIRSLTSMTADNLWHHFLMSMDTDTMNVHLYIDDVDDYDSVNSSFPSRTYDHTGPSYYIGSSASSSRYLIGCMYQFAFWSGSYINLSTTSNRRKFITSGLEPVDLGSDGSTAMGTAATIYQHLDALNDSVNEFLTNKGQSGDDFTVGGVSAILTKCPNSPTTD